MATLTGSDVTQAESTTAVNNLSSPARTDWIEFPQSATSVNRKSGGGSTIGLPTLLGAGTNFFSGYNAQGPARSWTDGTPTATGTNVQEGIFFDTSSAVSAGQGIQFTVPASTTQRVLEIGWFSYSGTSRVTATLSDASATAYTLNTTTTGLGNLVWHKTTITYAAASAGQTLTIQITMQTFVSNYGQVGLDYAAYTNTTTPSTAALSVTAQNATSSLAATERFPASVAVTAQNAAVSLAAVQLGTASGSYAISQATPTLDSTLDDWVIYPGYGTTWGSGNLERSATGTGELPSQPTVIGTATQRVRGSGSGGRNVNWAGGTPDATGTSFGGSVYVQGAATWVGPQGLRIPVPAGATKRVLKLYAWNYNGTAQLSLQFANGGAPTIVPLTTTTTGGVDWYDLSIVFQSPSADTLYVDFAMTAINGTDGTNAYVGIMAMSLAPYTVPVSAGINVTAQSATIAVAAGESYPATLNVTAQNAAASLAATEQFPAALAVTAQPATSAIVATEQFPAALAVTAQNATPNIAVAQIGTVTPSFVLSTATVTLDDTFDDWVDYPGSGSTWASPNLNRCAIGSHELPDFPTTIGSPTQGVRGNGSGTRNVNWSDGTLGASGTSFGGAIWTHSASVPHGMRIAVPAAAGTRTLKLYAYNWLGTAELRLTFANGGSTTVLPLTTATGADFYTITVQYQSPVPTTLYADLVMTAESDTTQAQMGLQAMSLTGGVPHNATVGVAVTAQNSISNLQVTSALVNAAALAVTADNATINAQIRETFIVGMAVAAQNAVASIQSFESERAIVNVTAQSATVALGVASLNPSTVSANVIAQNAIVRLATQQVFRIGVNVTAQNATASIATRERFQTAVNVHAQDAVAQLSLLEIKRRFQAAILGPQ